ncbi:unnamed protein product, partial [Symbiodinium sp. KB8]
MEAEAPRAASPTTGLPNEYNDEPTSDDGSDYSDDSLHERLARQYANHVIAYLQEQFAEAMSTRTWYESRGKVDAAVQAITWLTDLVASGFDTRSRPHSDFDGAQTAPPQQGPGVSTRPSGSSAPFSASFGGGVSDERKSDGAARVVTEPLRVPPTLSRIIGVPPTGLKSLLTAATAAVQRIQSLADSTAQALTRPSPADAKELAAAKARLKQVEASLNASEEANERAQGTIQAQRTRIAALQKEVEEAQEAVRQRSETEEQAIEGAASSLSAALESLWSSVDAQIAEFAVSGTASQ